MNQPKIDNCWARLCEESDKNEKLKMIYMWIKQNYITFGEFCSLHWKLFKRISKNNMAKATDRGYRYCPMCLKQYLREYNTQLFCCDKCEKKYDEELEKWQSEVTTEDME
jgi:ribosomal protein L37AE/L43A